MRLVGGTACLLVVLAALVVLPVAARGGVRVPIDRLRVQLEPVSPRSWWALLWEDARLRAGLIAPRPGTKYRVTAVAYSSTVGQTDLTPCITALGTRVRPGIVATNILPFGTCLKVRGLEIDRVVRVEDRMNERYNGKFIMDIWHPTKRQAREFGVRLLEIEVLAACPAELLVGRTSPATRSPEEQQDAAAIKELPRTLLLPVMRANIPEEEECLSGAGG